MLHLISTLVLGLLLVGILARQRRRLHLSLMLSAFAVDLGLVLYIETTRHAVEKVVTTPRPLIWFHATVSLLVLAAYCTQITLGWRMLHGFSASRQTHLVTGVAFCSLRLLNYVTSFML